MTTVCKLIVIVRALRPNQVSRVEGHFANVGATAGHQFKYCRMFAWAEVIVTIVGCELLRMICLHVPMSVGIRAPLEPPLRYLAIFDAAIWFTLVNVRHVMWHGVVNVAFIASSGIFGIIVVCNCPRAGEYGLGVVRGVVDV